MDRNANRINSSLSELEKLTGIRLALSEAGPADDETAEKLAQLVTAYKDKYDRTNFLRNILRGAVRPDKLERQAAHFHLAVNVTRALYVIEMDNEVEDLVARVLKQLFITRTGDFLVTVDGTRIAMIRTIADKNASENMITEARTIVDMINTEVMVRVRVAYGRICQNLGELTEAFNEAVYALEIGRVFYSNVTCLDFSRLGIGRLIGQLPEEVCRLFLREVFGDGSPDDFDEETKQVINAFFENNLNISETARKLYLHRNTLVYRLEKLHQTTGLDLRRFDHAMELKLAMMVSDYLKEKERS